MSYEKKNKLANIVAVLTVLFAIFVGVLMAVRSNDLLPIILGTGAFIYGPVCFIAYLVEIKKGVFKVDDASKEVED